MDTFLVVTLRVLFVLFFILFCASWGSAFCKRLSKCVQGRWHVALDVASVISLIFGIILFLVLLVAFSIEVVDIAMRGIQTVIHQWRVSDRGPAIGMLMGVVLCSVLAWLAIKFRNNPIARLSDKSSRWLLPREITK